MTWDPAIDNWILLTGLLCAANCALLGNYLVLRRLSLMGDAIAHAVLPGIAIAFLWSGGRSSLAMFIGAVLAGLATTVLTETVRHYGRVDNSAAMGVIFSVLFAVGLIFIGQIPHTDLDPDCVLYGNINDVGLTAMFEDGLPAVTRNLLAVLVLNVIFVGCFYKELKICAFDPQLATSLGIPATVMHYALMVMVAITTVASFEAVGSILVIGMLIVPAAAAALLSDRMGTMILWSLVLASVAAAGGQVVAMKGPGWIGLGPGTAVETAGMITVVLGILLVMVVIAAPHHGLLGRAWNRLGLRIHIVREDMLGLLYRWKELHPTSPPRRRDLLTVGGGSLMARVALHRLHRGGAVRETDGVVELTASGLEQAIRLVRSHRQWESYLALHSTLPLDHLHAPAERAEHYLTPQIRAALDADLSGVEQDPHGKDIPDV